MIVFFPAILWRCCFLKQERQLACADLSNIGRSCSFLFSVLSCHSSAKKRLYHFPLVWSRVTPSFCHNSGFSDFFACKGCAAKWPSSSSSGCAGRPVSCWHCIDLLKILSAPPDHWLDGPSAVLGENHLMSAPAASGSSATIRRRSVPHVNIQTKTTCEWKSHTTWTSVNKNILFPSTVVEYRISTKFNKRNDLFIQIEHRN